MSPTQQNFVGLPLLLNLPEAEREEWFWQKACELRVSVPVVVTHFNGTTSDDGVTAAQTVVVQPAIQENVYLNLNVTPVNLPLLKDVPIFMFRGGGFDITLPLKVGDEGWVIFADMCFNAWFTSGAPSSGPMPNQEERRRHDLSDGWFLPGGWSQPRNLVNYASAALQIRSDDGQTYWELQSGIVSGTPDGGTTKILMLGGQVTITAGTITLDGNVVITGSLDGKTFLTHQHTGVTTGGGDTGPVL
jgi:hypothetical protein